MPMRSVALVAGLLLAVGCVMPDQLSQIQKDVADVKQNLQRIEQDQGLLEERVVEIELEADDGPAGDTISRAELAEIRIDMDRFDRQMARVAERMNDVDQRMENQSQRYRQPRDIDGGGTTGIPPGGSDPLLPPPSRPPGGRGAMPDPEALYNSAYADFSKGNFALAISGFEEYHERFRESALADNALYWIAECHFSQGDFRSAVDALDLLLDLYPNSDKAAASNLKKALAFLEQNQVGQAIVQLRYVVSAYPTTDEARLARDKLASLGASPN